MVSTRLSRSGEDSSPFMGTRNSLSQRGITSRALRKLEIDGNDGLRGGSDEKSKTQGEVKVYHWRGAVYAVDENTPEEWIDAQPKRYLKRKRGNDSEQGINQGRRKRVAKRRKLDEDETDDDSASDSDSSNEADDSDEEHVVDEDENESEESSSSSSEEDEQDEATPPVKRPVGRPRKSLPTTRARSLLREPRGKPSPVSMRKRARSSPGRPPTPQSMRGPRGRPTKRRESPPPPQPARKKVGRPPKVTPKARQAKVRQSRTQHQNVEPISWADMMTGKIAISMTKFLAVQKQLRKLQHEYTLARDLHARVVAREKARKAGFVEEIVIDPLDTSSHLKVGASVQRTDSRLSRREDQPVAAATIAGASSPDGQRERASSFDTAPSHAEVTSPKTMPTPLQTQGSLPALEDLLGNEDRAEGMLLASKMISKETPEEKSKRINREWDKVMSWPRCITR